MDRQRISSFFKQAGIYLLMFFIISTVIDWWRGSDLPDSAIPPLQTQSVNGQNLDLATLSDDQLVIVYFWGSWCGPCKVTSPSINRLSKYYPVVSIAMSSGSDQALQKHAKENGFNFEVINDNDNLISSQWGVSATPLIVFVKNNQIVDHTTGISLLPGLFFRALINQ